MSEHLSISGQCLCKKVSINANKVQPHVDACHCDTCRKWSGSALLALDCGTEVTIEGQQHITVYDSSEWAER